MIKNGKKKQDKRYVLNISMSETAVRPERRADFRYGRMAVSDISSQRNGEYRSFIYSFIFFLPFFIIYLTVKECLSVEGQPPACLKNYTENEHQISLTLLKVVDMHYFDLDLGPMTLVLKFDLNMVVTYLHAKN